MVTNRVYKVLVSVGTEATSLASATTGQYLILKPDGSKWATSDTPTKADFFRIAVKAASGNWVFSDNIRVGDVTNLAIQAYAARVEQVITITPDTPVAGVEYTLTVLDKSDKDILQMRQNKRQYSVIAVTGETATTLNAKFIAKINADPGVVVVASGTTTLILTAKAVETTANIVGEYTPQIFFDVTFSIADPLTYLQKSGTIVYTTAPGFGSGNFDQVRRLEQRGLGYTGVTNRTKFPVEQGEYLSVSGINYDVIVLEAEKVYDSNSETFGLVGSPVTEIIAVTTSASATFLTLLQDVVGLTAS